jgi:hypothetical protein
MAGIFTLESSLNFIFHYPKFIVRKILNFLRCVGKKTAQIDKLIATLLQAEASACVSGLANVQFCALAVYYIVFFLSLSSKLSAVAFFLRLLVTTQYQQPIASISDLDVRLQIPLSTIIQYFNFS